MDEVLRALVDILEAGRDAVLATILTHEGSTPRSAGSRMLLDAREGGGVRIAAGTVGGGLVEARVLECAALALADGARRVESFDLTGGLAAGADMICGGRLRVFLERLAPADLPLWRALGRELAGGRRCLRLTPREGGPAALLPLGGEGNGLVLGLAPELARAVLEAGVGIQAPILLEHAGRAYALEPWIPPSLLLLFGAGHVSRPTARMAALCGFRVTVLDDRPEFASAARFPEARLRLLDSFSGCFAGLDCGPESFVVIVTRGHEHDAEVLAQALRTRAGYIGMIGSRRKREAVYQRLRAQGFGDADFARVRCPIGLDIGAETPEEIAVSIVAELVQRRASGAGR